jgi:hypothetical protein
LNGVRNTRFPLNVGISLIPETVLTSQEGLCYTELVIQCFTRGTERQTIHICDLDVRGTKMDFRN